MNNLYLYNAKYKDDEVEKYYAIVFFQDINFDFDDFSKSLDNYFESNPLPEKIILIVPGYLKGKFEETISDRIIDLNRVIPTKFNRNNAFEFIQPFFYNIDGKLAPSSLINEVIDDSLLPQMFNNALVNIFKVREGLIKSEIAHHFVFPSGKHCDYFLRPGNILQKGNEIFFIAFNLLDKLKVDDKIIYCDTSSINSIAFALIEIKRRFLGEKYIPPYIESFGSYSAFESHDFTFIKKSLFLVSSSTSSRIIERLLEKKVALDQIALIFCMGRKNEYRNNIICDLQYDSATNPDGIKKFKSYELAGQCELCKRGSIAVEVTGDVFQIEKPKLTLIEIKVTDAPRFHQEFMKSFFRRKSDKFSFLRSHYYEASHKEALSQPSFEIFLDVSGLIKDVDKFPSFKKKLDNYIIQFIPSKTKFIIYLPDDASRAIANYIKQSLESSVKNVEEIILISQNELFESSIFQDYKENAAVVIVASSIINGSRLLYISREMRDFSNLSLIYFIGFSRTEDETYLTFLKNNLTMGKYGISTNSFIELERIHTPNDRQNTTWVVETQFLIMLKNYCEDTNEVKYEEVIKFLADRIKILDDGYISSGICDGLFYPNVLLNKELTINKNFAFYRFDGYKDNASQSDVYFTVATIINALRNSSDQNRKIVNSHFVRTLLAPNNFNRYNDGIIQAAVLRAAHSKELSYDLDKKLSSAMLDIIIGIVEFSNENHGEALLEFLYAIAIKKLRLKDYHIKELFKKIKAHKYASANEIILAYVDYCEKITFGADSKLSEEYSLKLDFY